MSEAHKSNLRLEIAHVLFLDVVGYSKLLLNEQREALESLKTFVRQTAAFKEAEAEGTLTLLPTGDGMALVFSSTPEAPVECAVELGRALRNQPDLPVRMGIHSGPISSVSDVTDRANVAGAGINFAQRVMDCGDAGHILVSQRVAEDLGQTREWKPYLHDLGECTVKHAVRIRVFNLHGDDFGTPSIPDKVSAQKQDFAKARRRRVFRIGAIVLSGIILLAAVAFFLNSRRTPPPTDKSIAVLPFENMSDDKANGYFADGIQDDILTSLAQIRDLRVISRTSVERYRGEKESHNLPQIAKDLGATNVLEGSVRREGNRIVVNVQLIDALHDRHIWANRYDKAISDSLGLQGELAREIAGALQATLTADEAARVQVKPTSNGQAYELYLQGRQYELRPDTFLQDYKTAEQLYVQAVTADPKFALAHARLAVTRARIYHFFEPTDLWRRGALTEANLALELQSDLGEGHQALGLCHYWFDRDYPAALQEFAKAQALMPNNTDIPWHVAAIKRRQGHWDEAAADYNDILTRDPQNANVIRDLLYVYCSMRDWPNAEKTSRRLLELTPDSVNARFQAGYVEFWVKGTTERLKRELAAVPAGKDPDGSVTSTWIDANLIDRDYAAAERHLSASPLEFLSYFNSVDTPRSYFAGVIALMRGDAAAAHSQLEHARDFFAQNVKDSPKVPEAHAFLGLTCALLGEKERAIAEGTQAVHLRPESVDALDGAVMNGVMAMIYAQTGEHAKAIELIKHLLSVPGAVDSASYSITSNDLKYRWEWDPLRSEPEFQAILARP